MSDLIDRNSAIHAFAKHMRNMAVIDHPYADETIEGWKPLAKSILDAVPTEMHWTPTASRLPDPGRYLVTVKRYGKHGTKTSVSNYNNGTWSGYDTEDVLAWMPLPAPMEGNE